MSNQTTESTPSTSTTATSGELAADQEARFRAWQNRKPAAPGPNLPLSSGSADGGSGWGWSPWYGVHYNGFPVGICVVVVLFLMTRM